MPWGKSVELFDGQKHPQGVLDLIGQSLVGLELPTLPVLVLEDLFLVLLDSPQPEHRLAGQFEIPFDPSFDGPITDFPGRCRDLIGKPVDRLDEILGEIIETGGGRHGTFVPTDPHFIGKALTQSPITI